MNNMKSIRIRNLVVITSLLLLAGTFASQAQYTFNQTAAGTYAWTTPGNWTAAGVPVSGTTATVTNFLNVTTALGQPTITINTDPSTFTMNSLTLNGLGASATAATTVNLGTAGNTWTLGGTTPTINLNGLTGTQGLIINVNPNITLGANLTVAGAGTATFNFPGSMTGAFSLTDNATTPLTLANANYTGATTVNGSGILTITGGTFGSSTSAFIAASATTTGTATISGGMMLAGSVSIGPNGSSGTGFLTISGNANATFSTGVTIGANGKTAKGVIINTSGTVSLGAVNAIRDNGTGLTIQNGTVTATSVDISAASTSSSTATEMIISGGSLTISAASGGLKISDNGGLGSTADTASLTMSGGTLTYLGSDGLLTAASAPLSGKPTVANVTFSSGTTKLTGITLNAANAALVTSPLNTSGGAILYLGSVGLVFGTGGTSVSATLGTSTIGALANWSSSAPISLTGTPVTFQAADSSANPFNITLGGVLSGAGSLTKTGVGTLTLNAANTYTGNTTNNAGTLQINGSIASAVTVNSGATNAGSGTISNSVLVNTGGVTRPGATGVTNTITGNLTYSNGAAAYFDLNTSATGNNNDQIKLSGASSVLTISNAVPLVVNLIGATLDQTADYLLITNLTGSISGSFSNTPVWLGTPPAGSTNYSIVTGSKSVVLHYTPSTVGPTITTSSASPNPAYPNQSVLISATVVTNGATLNSITADVSAIAGITNGTTTSLALVSTGPGNVYTNSVTVGSAVPTNSVRSFYLTAIDNASFTNLATNTLTITSGAPTVSGSASPSTVGRGQTTLITATVVSNSYPIDTTSVKVSSGSVAITGSPVSLVLQSGNVYTNTVTIDIAATLGAKTLTLTAADTGLETNTGTVSLTVGNIGEVWNGLGGVDNTWGAGANWVSTSAPQTGDLVTFAGSTQLTPNMEVNYNIAALTFDAMAGSFTITNGANTLTLTGGVTNNSTSAETIAVPITLSSPQTLNAASGNLAITNINIGANLLTVTAPFGITATVSGVVTGSGGLTKNGTGAATLSANNSYTGTTTVNAGNATLSGNNNLASAIAITGGALNFSGTETLSGVATITAGSLNITGGTTTYSTTGNPNLTIGNSGTATGTLSVSLGATFADSGASTFGFMANAANSVGVINNAGTMTFAGSGFLMGHNTSASGAIYNTGTFTVNLSNNNLDLGNGTGAYGYLYNSGTASVASTANSTANGWLSMGHGNTATTAAGSGVVDVTGGNLSVAFAANLRVNDNQASSVSQEASQINVTGGTLTAGSTTPGTVPVNGFANSYASINISGGSAVFTTPGAGGINLNVANNPDDISTLSLTNGGTLNTSAITGTGTTSSQTLTLNGGNLNATAAGTLIGANVTTFVEAGGGTIGNGGFATTIASALQSPAGNGVTGISLAGTTSGYVGAPVVIISGGGGKGAAAIATFDPTTGTITGISVTSPGSGYTGAPPTVTLLGGSGNSGTTGATAGPATGTATTGAVSSGGVTFTGTGGTTTLTGTNTYTGATTISAGTLALGASSVLASGTTVNLAGGTLAMGTFNNTVNALQFNGVGAAAGTWGSTGSTANHQTSQITGSGILTVTTGGTSGSVVTSSLNPSVYGSPVTFTNTVTTSGGIPTGTVTFKEGATTLGTAALANGSGNTATATLTLSTLTAATHSITAVYGGDNNFDVSTSSALSQVINPLAVTLTGTRVYDGTTNASFGILTVANPVGGDVVTVASGLGGLASSAAGSQTINSVGTLALSGGVGTNYTLTSFSGSVNITALPVTLSGTRAYDGTTNAAFGILSVANVVAGDTVTVASGTGGLAAAAVGTEGITSFGTLALGGASVANYTLTGASGSVVITALPVNLTGTRAYDGTTNAAFGILSVANVVAGDTVTVASGTGGLAAATAGSEGITSFGTLALGGASVVNYTLTGASGSVLITQATTSVVVSSTNNPSGYHDSVVFTAALPAAATGNVVFLTNGTAFDTEALSSGSASSLSITNLPRGTNTITVQYAGDANYLGSTNDLSGGQIVTNHPPVANVSSYSRPSGFTLKIPVPGSLSTNWSDVDGDTVTLSGSISSTDSATVSYDSNFVYYSDPNNVADQVNYTVSDGHGGTNAGVINITIAAASTNQTQNITGITANPGGSVTISFASVPDSTNVVQRAGSVTGPWTDLSTNLAGANGLWQFTDPPTPPSPSFYRSKRQP